MESHEFKGKWFVLYTRNKQERVVREELQFRSIVPVIERKKIKRARAGQTVTVIELEPKYPNYVFVQHDGSAHFFEECLKHRHVVSFAGGDFDEKKGIYPVALTKKEEENIFAHELSRNIEVGGDVYVIDGIYKGQKGKVVRLGEKVLVRLKIYNLEVEELIPEEFLSINEQG